MTAMPKLVCAGGRFTTSTSGTITGTSDVYGCTVTKTGSETGRYTITLNRATVKFMGGHASVVGPDDTAMTTTKGLVPVWRDDDLATDGTVELQFVETVTANADTELQDGASVRFMVWFIDTSVS